MWRAVWTREAGTLWQNANFRNSYIYNVLKLAGNCGSFAARHLLTGLSTVFSFPLNQSQLIFLPNYTNNWWVRVIPRTLKIIPHHWKLSVLESRKYKEKWPRKYSKLILIQPILKDWIVRFLVLKNYDLLPTQNKNKALQKDATQPTVHEITKSLSKIYRVNR